MSALRRLLGASTVALCLAALGAQPAAAATGTAPAVPSAPAPGTPRVFQITPPRVNPLTEPNIMLVGQNLTASTRVLVGGRPATTVEATGYTLLARLPEGLASGSYALQVVGNGTSSVAPDQVVVDDAPSGPSQMTLLAGGGFALLFLLVMRLGRTPRYSFTR